MSTEVIPKRAAVAIAFTIVVHLFPEVLLLLISSTVPARVAISIWYLLAIPLWLYLLYKSIKWPEQSRKDGGM
jgi:hypothetical protein